MGLAIRIEKEKGVTGAGREQFKDVAMSLTSASVSA